MKVRPLLFQILLVCLFAGACADKTKVSLDKTISLCNRPSCLTPEVIQFEVTHLGAKGEVNRLWSNDSLWSTVLKGISSGSAKWLDVAERLRPSTDGGASETITLALGEALEYEPNSILNRFGSANLASICSGPDIDDVRFGSYENAIRSLNARVKAVQTVQEPRLREDKKNCLSSLKREVLAIQNYFGIKSDTGDY